MHGEDMHGTGGLHGMGACMAEGVHGRIGHAWQGSAWQRGALQGACMAGGMHGRGHVWRGCVWQGVCSRGACVAGETATAVDGTHPTEMHSCLRQFFWSKDTISRYVMTF